MQLRVINKSSIFAVGLRCGVNILHDAGSETNRKEGGQPPCFDGGRVAPMLGRDIARVQNE